MLSFPEDFPRQLKAWLDSLPYHHDQMKRVRTCSHNSNALRWLRCVFVFRLGTLLRTPEEKGPWTYSKTQRILSDLCPSLPVCSGKCLTICACTCACARAHTHLYFKCVARDPKIIKYTIFILVNFIQLINIHTHALVHFYLTLVSISNLRWQLTSMILT